MSTSVARLGPEAERDVVGVFCEAFREYPVMRHVLVDSDRYAEELDVLVSFFVGVRVLRAEPMLGVWDDEGLVAAATVSRPGAAASESVTALGDRTWAALGEGARARYEAYGRATAPFEVDQPHVHLNMIGVRDRGRGSGLGGALLDAVHALSSADPRSEGVTLATESERNVRLYQRFGYQIVGTASVDGAFQSWGFWRPDRAEGSS